MHALKYRLEIFFVALIASAGFFVLYQNNIKNRTAQSVSIPSFLVHEALSPTPAPTASKSSPQSVSWTSSDAALRIIMQTKLSPKTGTKAYSFFISKNGQDENNPPFFNKTTDALTSFSIPFNSFSPDDKYLFLKEDRKGENHYLVFSTSGTLFANGEKFLDITPLFNAKYNSSYVLSEVTGWASNTLLIIETENINGTPSTSFWFDVTTKSFIPLATRF